MECYVASYTVIQYVAGHKTSCFYYLDTSTLQWCMHLLCSSDFGSMYWNVPVTISTKNKPNAIQFVLDKASDVVVVEKMAPDDWILVSLQRVCCNPNS